jgi:hypothetical protein
VTGSGVGAGFFTAGAVGALPELDELELVVEVVACGTAVADPGARGVSSTFAVALPGVSPSGSA